MQKTPQADRLQIALFGRRNTGKSSIINALTGQQVALVSEIPGTTTDPVVKAMELGKLGPVLFIDTAGLDDEGTLGELRIAKSRAVLGRTDLILMVIEAEAKISELEEELVQTAKERQIPLIAVINKIDRLSDEQKKSVDSEIRNNVAELKAWFKRKKLPAVAVSALTGEGIERLKDVIIEVRPDSQRPQSLLGGLLEPGKKETAILVCPIDKAAPKGRLILPQVQTIRAALDMRAKAFVVTEKELSSALEGLKAPPSLVITDSQVFNTVASIVPETIPLTSFSIIYARYKGDLWTFVEGAQKIDTLQGGEKILIAEACTHRPIEEDIGRVKIPGLLEKRVGAKLDFSWSVGGDFPENLDEYQLVIHCGGCMISRAAVLQRLRVVKNAGVPVVNYGVCLAYLNGILERVIKPFRISVPD
ncbi:MAG: [FeFe] hydrogenase H-cluster maturation GTPase HydF [Dethiobacteria bacterium]